MCGISKRQTVNIYQPAPAPNRGRESTTFGKDPCLLWFWVSLPGYHYNPDISLDIGKMQTTNWLSGYE